MRDEARAINRRRIIIFSLVYFFACALLKIFTRVITTLLFIVFNYNYTALILITALDSFIFAVVVFAALFGLVWVLAGGKLSAYLTGRNIGIIALAGAGYALTQRVFSVAVSMIIGPVFEGLELESSMETAEYISMQITYEVIWLAVLVLAMLIIWKLTFRLYKSLPECFLAVFGNGRSRFILPVCILLYSCAAIIPELYQYYEHFTYNDSFLGIVALLTMGGVLIRFREFSHTLIMLIIALAIYKACPAAENTEKESLQ